MKTMTTHPLHVALERADMLGWEHEPTLEPRRADGVAVVIHHRTGFRAEVCCHQVDDQLRWSNSWWLDDGEQVIHLLGDQNFVNS